MKTPITTLILLATLSLNVFAQQEIPMFFDNDLMLQTNASNLAAYSPDGSKIATVFGRGKVVIWDAATGRVITKLAGHSDQSTNIINDIVFSPNGRQLASCASNDSTVKIWDTTSGSLIRSIRQDGVSVISFSPDGNHIVGVSYSGSSNEYSIKIWNTANGSELRTLVGHTNFIFSVTYNSNGRQILTASNDRSIRIWDAGNGQILKVINSEAQFRDAIYSPNGRYIAVSSIGRGNNISAIRIFNAETGQAIREIPIQPAGNFNIAYSPDGRQLLFNTYDDNRNRIIKIFDPETGRELRSFNNGDSALAFSPDGQRILTASSSFSLTIENNPYGASYATFLDATTGRVTGTIGYGPLNVGARAYADLQIARFLNDTAAVNRHEAVLQYIIGRGNATRAEIETFYRNNIRALISQVVDEEFRGITVPASTVTYVKNSLTNFYTTPNQTNLNILKNIYDSTSGNLEFIQQGYDRDMRDIEEIQRTRPQSPTIEMFRETARYAQNILNERRRQLNAPNDAPIDWSNFRSAYERILNGFNPELVRRMR